MSAALMDCRKMSHKDSGIFLGQLGVAVRRFRQFAVYGQGIKAALFEPLWVKFNFTRGGGKSVFLIQMVLFVELRERCWLSKPNWLARLIILDTAEVDTPIRLATSAKVTPCLFTNPIAIIARTPETSLRRLPDLNSLIDTLAFLHNLVINSSIFFNLAPSPAVDTWF